MCVRVSVLYMCLCVRWNACCVSVLYMCLCRVECLLCVQCVCAYEQYCTGMLHLHCGVSGQQIIHRDLAARNVLLNRGVALISDMGMARVKSDESDASRTANTSGPLKVCCEQAYIQQYENCSNTFSLTIRTRDIKNRTQA